MASCSSAPAEIDPATSAGAAIKKELTSLAEGCSSVEESRERKCGREGTVRSPLG
jgi:hypothetical protein